MEQQSPAAKSPAWKGLLVLGCAALVIRLSYLHQLRDTPFFSILIGDSLEYDAWAMRIAGGDWIGREVFYQSPLYPYLLAVFYKVAGHHVFGVRVVQAVLGSLSCALLAIAGRRFFDARTGLIAGGMLAVYPAAIFFDGLIQKSALDVFLVCTLLVALGACLESPKKRSIVAAGLAMGALALNRENARVLYPVLAAWFLLSHHNDPLKRRLLRVAVFTLAAAAVVLPVAARNVRVGGEFLISTSQFGPNFYIGNRHGATGGYAPLVEGRGNAAFERKDARRLAEKAAGRALTAGEVSDYWWRRALAEIREAPVPWLGLSVKKTWLTFSATEPVDTESLEAYARESSLLRALRWFTFGIVMALAVLGAWATRTQWRRLWVLHAAFVALAFSVVLFYVFARYRFPLVPIAMLFAGAGLAALVEKRSRPVREWAPLALGAVVIAGLLHIPVQTSADETLVNYGSEMLRLGRTADAVPLLLEAVRLDPTHAPARLSLALALEKSGEAQSAIPEFEAAARLDPRSSEARAGLAMALQRQGRTQEAILMYEEALRLDPVSVETMSNLALALHESGRSDTAVTMFARALAIQPTSLPLRMNLGRVLLGMGRTVDAIASFRLAAASAQQPAEIVETEYALAQALAAAGRIEEAVSSLERAHAAARVAGDAAALSSIEEALQILKGR